MSYFNAEVVELKLEPHVNSEFLSVVRLEKPLKTTVVVKTADWLGRDKAIYCPVDAILPDKPEYNFLGGSRRVKAKKFRGIMSQGLLLPALEEDKVGDVVTERLGITKYEEADKSFGDNLQVKDPEGSVTYTDIENVKKYHHLLQVGTEVVLTEKIHGACSRYVWQDKLHIGTHKRWISSSSHWGWVAQHYKLAEKLETIPNRIVFGEVFGKVQDLKYDIVPGTYGFRVFDIYDISLGKYLDYEDLCVLTTQLELKLVPELYIGTWKGLEEMKGYAEGQSTIANHVREGFVVRPLREAYNEETGRTILKLHGEDYLTRKQKDAA